MLNNWLRFVLIQLRAIFFILFPKAVVAIEFRRNAGYWPNLKNPQTFNEKLTWLKLYWRDPLAVTCADKYAVRDFVAERSDVNILNQMFGVFDKVEDIDFDQLPDRFVLKITHGCGYNIFCKSKSDFDWEEAKRRLSKWQETNYSSYSLEWVYKDIKPKIICEKYIETKDDKPPRDYKVFCFNGEPKMLFVASDRIGDKTKFDFYTCNWERIPVKNHYPNNPEQIERPRELEELLRYSRKLSHGFPHVRVDYYIESGKIIFGEMTFFHFSGNQPFEPFEYDLEFGKYLTLFPRNLE